ncbi:trypsin-like serine protease [Bradyrhizobium ottawaense]|uniref:trypsin-like serine protease n=1 Tax=Bradyrhizobium ottawaense TaxID=931866 RepID=UPI003F9FA04D
MLPSYFWIIILILILSAEAAAAQSQERIMAPLPSTNAANVQIIGGKPATPADWPATLMFDGNLGRCTSTIVGTYVVLTAAHCVDDKSPAKLAAVGQPTYRSSMPRSSGLSGQSLRKRDRTAEAGGMYRGCCDLHRR